MQIPSQNVDFQAQVRNEFYIYIYKSGLAPVISSGKYSMELQFEI